jgi:general stress protein YciG
MEEFDFLLSPGNHGGDGNRPGSADYGNNSVTGASQPATSERSKRGFAAMDPEKQREIASKGGKASHGGGRNSNSGGSQGGNRGR